VHTVPPQSTSVSPGSWMPLKHEPGMVVVVVVVGRVGSVCVVLEVVVAKASTAMQTHVPRKSSHASPAGHSPSHSGALPAQVTKRGVQTHPSDVTEQTWPPGHLPLHAGSEEEQGTVVVVVIVVGVTVVGGCAADAVQMLVPSRLQRLMIARWHFFWSLRPVPSAEQVLWHWPMSAAHASRQALLEAA
jgi:hypothetical protein